MAKYSVSYVYEIVDKYSKTIDKIKRKTNDFAYSASKATTKASLAFQKFGKTIKKVGKDLLVKTTVPITALGALMIKNASDAEETRSKYATVFKELGEGAEVTANKFAKSFGLAGSKARQLLGDTGDMLSGFGFTSEAALKLSERTNSLAVDLASFTNFSGGAEGASNALTKALLGERESVKALGIAILESDVKKKVSQMRSQGQRFATEREAKAYATLEIAISQSKNAIGDYARTKNGFANVQRRVAQRNLELRESFGKILLPVATKTLLIINKLQEKFIDLSPAMKKNILIILSLVAVIAPLLIIFGSIMIALPVITSGFWALVAVASLLYSPITIIVAIMYGLVKVFQHAYKYNNRFKDGVDNMVSSVKSAFQELVNTLAPIFEKLFGWYDRLNTGAVKLGLSAMQKIGFYDGLDFNVNNNPAAQGAVNNTLTGSIDVTANNATVNKSVFSANDKPIQSNMAGAR